MPGGQSPALTGELQYTDGPVPLQDAARPGRPDPFGIRQVKLGDRHLGRHRGLPRVRSSANHSRNACDGAR